MGQKTQTLIMLPNGDVAKRIDDFLYQTLDFIIINDTEWHKWRQYDEFDCEGWLVRKIWLKQLRGAFKEGLESANNHWQEKTRWKSLIKEPPHHYPKRYFLRMGLNGEPRSMPFYYIDYGFTEWKEIE